MRPRLLLIALTVVLITAAPAAALHAPSACGQLVQQIGRVTPVYLIDTVAARAVSCRSARGLVHRLELHAQTGAIPARVLAPFNSRTGRLIFHRYGPAYAFAGWSCQFENEPVGASKTVPGRARCQQSGERLITWSYRSTPHRP